MKKISLSVTLLIVMFFYSCSNPYEKKISDPDARKYLEQICNRSDSATCAQLESGYYNINMIKIDRSEKLDAYCFFVYGYPYKELTFNDLIKTKPPELNMIN